MTPHEIRAGHQRNTRCPAAGYILTTLPVFADL